jgi:hypothetical protein
MLRNRLTMGLAQAKPNLMTDRPTNEPVRCTRVNELMDQSHVVGCGTGGSNLVYNVAHASLRMISRMLGADPQGVFQ